MYRIISASDPDFLFLLRFTLQENISFVSGIKLYAASGKAQLNIYLASKSVYLCHGKQDRWDSVGKLFKKP